MHCISTQVHKDKHPLTTTTSGHNGHCPSSGPNCISTHVHNDQLGQRLLTTATSGYSGSLAYIYSLNFGFPIISPHIHIQQNCMVQTDLDHRCQVMLNILCTTLFLNFHTINLQHSSHEHIFTEWKTVWFLTRWLHQKPADLDLQCLLKKINLGSAGQGLRALF